MANWALRFNNYTKSDQFRIFTSFIQGRPTIRAHGNPTFTVKRCEPIIIMYRGHHRKPNQLWMDRLGIQQINDFTRNREVRHCSFWEKWKYKIKVFGILLMNKISTQVEFFFILKQQFFFCTWSNLKVLYFEATGMIKGTEASDPQFWQAKARRNCPSRSLMLHNTIEEV